MELQSVPTEIDVLQRRLAPAPARPADAQGRGRGARPRAAGRGRGRDRAGREGAAGPPRPVGDREVGPAATSRSSASDLRGGQDRVQARRWTTIQQMQHARRASPDEERIPGPGRSSTPSGSGSRRRSPRPRPLGDGAAEGRPAAAQEGGRLRGDRRGRQPVDRHPGRQDAHHRAREAAQAGGPDPPPDGQPGRRRQGRRRRRPPEPGRAAGPEPADRLVPVPRARPASARPSWPRPWPSSSSTARPRWSGST